MSAYVYMLRCSDGSLYTGWTNDAAKRIAAHNDGSASRCTRARRPVALVYLETCGDKSAAMSREAEIKNLKRGDKLALINDSLDRSAAAARGCGVEITSI